jgi:hypothetical protein
MNQTDIENLNKYLAKLKVSGISLDIATETEDGIPLLLNIDKTNDLVPTSIYIDVKSLNNGRIKVRYRKLFNYDINLNDLDYTVQSSDVIEYMLYQGMLGQRKPLASKLSQAKQEEIEQSIKKIVSTNFTRGQDHTAHSDLRDTERLMTQWFKFKYLNYAIMKLDEQHSIENEKFNGYYHIPERVDLDPIADLVDQLDRVVAAYGMIILNKSTVDELTLKTIEISIYDIMKKFHDLIGCMYEIFEPELDRKTTKDISGSAMIAVRSILIPEKKDLLYKLKEEMRKLLKIMSQVY